MFGLHVCLCATFMLGALGGQKGALALWDWSYRQLRDAMRVLGINPGTAEACLQLP